MQQEKHHMFTSYDIDSFDTNEACDVVCAAIRGTLDTTSAHFLGSNVTSAHQLLIKSLELKALRKCLDLASREFEVIEENQKEDSKGYEVGETPFPKLPIELIAYIFAIAYRTEDRNCLGRSSVVEVIRWLHPEHMLRRLVLSKITYPIYPIFSTSAFEQHRDSIEDLRAELHESDPARLDVTWRPGHYGEYEQFCSDLSRMPHRLHSLTIHIDPSLATGSRDLSSVLPIIRHFHSLVLRNTARTRTPTFNRVFSELLQQKDAPWNIRTATMDIQILDTCDASGFLKGITKLKLYLDSSRSLRKFLAPLSHLHDLATLVLRVPISDGDYHDNSVCTDPMKLKSLKSLSLFGFTSAQTFSIFKLLSSCLLEEIEVHSGGADWVAVRDIFMKVAEWFPKLTSLICDCCPGTLLEILGEPSPSGTWCFPNLIALSLVTRLDVVQLISVLQNRLQARSESGAVAGLNKLVLGTVNITTGPRNEVVWGRSLDVLNYYELSKLVPNIYLIPLMVILL